jgi:polysaccharide pyruvyl transferase WcaK-like protein
MARNTVTFFGNFGTRNLGNECTLQAIIQNFHRYAPAASVNCVCSDPRGVALTHGIPAFAMSYRGDATRRAGPSHLQRNPVIRFVRRVAIRLPREALDWVRAYRTLKGTRMLVMTGTGMLGDFGIGPLDLHYEILKWSIVARLRGCKLLFVSVGAGPIADPLSRRLVKAALSLAHYRSYRDPFSKDFLLGIGFDTSKDRVYPDLAFSLVGHGATPIARNGHQSGPRPIVGLGLMDYYGERLGAEDGERLYQRYVERMARFAAWLLEQGYPVSLLIGDASYDKRVRRDVLRHLEEVGLLSSHQSQIVAEPISSPEELYAQLAQTDVVVATRFHNVLLAMLFNRPVIALSYHEKIRSLMAGFGAQGYCHDAANVDVARLIEQFRTLEENASNLASGMQQTADAYRRALDEQYARIFGSFATRQEPVTTATVATDLTAATGPH